MYGAKSGITVILLYGQKKGYTRYNNGSSPTNGHTKCTGRYRGGYHGHVLAEAVPVDAFVPSVHNVEAAGIPHSHVIIVADGDVGGLEKTGIEVGNVPMFRGNFQDGTAGFLRHENPLAAPG